MGDIGIVPIFYDTFHYCLECRAYVDQCLHKPESVISVSGTQARQMFQENKMPPEWFMRPEISEVILEEYRLGREVFVNE